MINQKHLVKSAIKFTALFACLFADNRISTTHLSSPNLLQKKSFSHVSENRTIQTLDLYGSVMFYYYQEYINALYINDSALNFEEFESNFHSSGLKIEDFISDLVACTSHSKERNKVSSYSSSSDDVSFQLGNTIYEITPGNLFNNGAPLYNAFDYSILQVGDIILEDSINYYWHTCVISDLNHSVSQLHSVTSYIQTIEAINNSEGVQYGYLDDQRILDHKVKIARYKNRDLSDSEKNSVIKFATAQIAKPYSLHNSVHASITSPSWYCNELVWAAYQYAGINIAPSYTDYDTILLGTTIYGTNRTINIKKEVYLSFGIKKKNLQIGISTFSIPYPFN